MNALERARHDLEEAALRHAMGGPVAPVTQAAKHLLYLLLRKNAPDLLYGAEPSPQFDRAQIECEHAA